MSKDKSSSISIWDDVSEKLESLREALNISIDESDSSDKPSDKSDLLPNNYDTDTVSFGTYDIKSLREIFDTPVDDTSSSHEPIEESQLPSQNEEHDSEDLSGFDNKKVEPSDAEQSNISEPPAETVEEIDSIDIKDLNYNPTLNNQIQTTNEHVELDFKQENQEMEIKNSADEEKELEDLIDPQILAQQPDETKEKEDKQETQNAEIKINTKQSINDEKIGNYWKQSETTNPYIKQVDESREVLNKSLEMARELVNRQSVETPKQEKKRFQLGFIRGDKNENNKSNTEKEKEKKSKKSVELKPMVYEILEIKQENQINEPNQSKQATNTEQNNKGKHEKRQKEKTKPLDNRMADNQETEIINFRNRLEKSKSLGVPVFVKKPVNLEQIRQLKSMLANQYNAKILVDTGSSQGRLLVISGQDPDTLLNTLGQLTIVKSTTIEHDTINLVLQT